MNYQALDLESFEFLSDSNWYLRFDFNFTRKLTSLIGTTLVKPPVVRKKGIKRYYSYPDLEQLGRGIGFDAPAILETLALHRQRLKSRAWLTFLLSLPAVLPMVFGIIWLQDILLQRGASFAAQLAVVYAFLPVLFLLIVSILKISSLFVDRSYADTLCIYAVISLIIELSRDDALLHPAKKRALLARMNDLARSTLLLPLTFASKAETTKNWLREHFRQMESYVRERQRWAIAPQDTTLEDMRQDFYRLANVYIIGNYGDFAWPEGKGETRAEETPRPSPTRRLLSGLPRFIMGIVLPLLGLALIVLQPGSIKPLGIEAPVLSLIFIAWFLLAVDSMLNLGVVAGIADLAKGLKELS